MNGDDGQRNPADGDDRMHDEREPMPRRRIAPSVGMPFSSRQSSISGVLPDSRGHLGYPALYCRLPQVD